MRAQLLHGTGSTTSVGVFGARIAAIPQKRQRSPEQNVNGVGESVTAAVQWLGQNAAAIAQWVGTLFSWLGPGYDASNGGEVARQLEQNLGDPWCNSYMDWIKNYRQDLWESGDIWDAGDDSPSAWRDVYLRYIALGLPEGFLMDANKVPVGLGSAIAAVEAQNAVENQPGADPIPTEAQLQALQILALQIAGAEGAQVAAQAAATVAQFPRSWQAYVADLVTAWQTSTGPTDGPGTPPAEAGFGGTGTLLLAGATVLILANR